MGIEVALLAILSKNAEAKTSRGGKPYLRLNCRVGDGPAAQWVAVVAFDEKTVGDAEKFLKGAVVYVEGKLTLNKWKAADGSERAGLSVLSRHCRLAGIGRNKEKPRRRMTAPTLAPAVPGKQHADFDDELPGWTP